MGALTIKNYYYESRPWELLRVCVPNLLTSYPSYVLLCFKNESLLKILPWNRNEFISNKLRFALDFFSNIFDFNEEKSLKDDLSQILISYILMLQYIYDLFSSKFKMFTHFKSYKFNLSSNFFVIHNYLNQKIFNFKLKDYKLLQFSNLNFLNFSHFVFLTNFNDCLIDFFTHICIDQNNMLKFTDFYYYLYNNNLLSSNRNILDDKQIIEEQYNDKFSILNFLRNSYFNLNVKFFYKLILRRIVKKFIVNFADFSITLKNMLFNYFPYHISYDNNLTYLLCFFYSFNYINSIGFFMTEQFKDLKLNKKNK